MKTHELIDVANRSSKRVNLIVNNGHVTTDKEIARKLLNRKYTPPGEDVVVEDFVAEQTGLNPNSPECQAIADKVWCDMLAGFEVVSGLK